MKLFSVTNTETLPTKKAPIGFSLMRQYSKCKVAGLEKHL